MTNRDPAVPPTEMMSDAEDALYRRMFAELAEKSADLAEGSGLGVKAGVLVGMAAMRLVSEAVWRSLSPSMRTEANFRARLTKLVAVSADNLMLDLRGSRTQ